MSTTVPLKLPDAWAAVAFVKANWYLFLAAYLVFRAIYNIFFHPLAKYPGPWLAKVSDVWKAKTMAQKRFKNTLVELHKKHGDVVRIGPNEVSLNIPDAVREIYGSKTSFTKGPMYDALSVGGRNHVTHRDPKAHSSDRRAVASAYTLSNILTLESVCDPYVDLVCAHLDTAAKSTGKAIDVSEVVEWYAYDAVSAIAFGKSYGFLENENEIRSITKMLHEATWIIGIPSMLNSIGWVMGTGFVNWLGKTLARGRGPMIFEVTAERFVREREALRLRSRDQYENKKDMLYRFLEATKPTTGQKFTREEVIREGQVIVLAGADANRSSMTAFIRYIYDSPSALAKVREEIDAAIARNEFDVPPTHAQVAKLEYLQAAIKESVRLFSAVGMTLQRVVPEGGSVLGGEAFPAGTFVGVSPWIIHHDPRAYGKDATEFRPERWLEGNRNDLEQYYLSFGQGTRICLGKHLAYIIIFKLLPTIVHLYDLEFTLRWPDGEPYLIADANAITQSRFDCRVKRRRH